MSEKIRKEYTNGEVTVTWQPHLCNHASICLMKLPEVFRMSKRPWINMSGADTKQIIDVVKQCPTLAIDYFMNEGFTDPTKDESSEKTTEIEILQNGPLIIKGKVKIKINGKEDIINEVSTALCRCGLSKDQPFCDGAHFGKTFE